jgi:hypothetical protein
MVLSDALSRRADMEESKEKDRTEVLLPKHLFVNLLDLEFAKLLSQAAEKEYDPSVLERFKFLQGEPETLDPEWKIVFNKGLPILYYKDRKYVPKNTALRRTILQEYHDHETAGHPGAATTYSHVSRDYWWPGMAGYVKEYVKGCAKCQQFKINRKPWNGPLQPISGPIDSRPFAQISMDLMTNLPPTDEGLDTLLVVVDHGLSKGLILVPTRKTATSHEIARLLQDNVFQRFGLPKTIISDRDPRFASIVFQEWLKLMKIKSAMSTAYHPQTDGATERVMQEIQAYLSIYCIANPSDWINSISLLEFVHNSRPHADRKQSPFELIMGFQPSALPQNLLSTKVPNLEERLNRLYQWRKDAQLAHEIARTRMKNRISKPLTQFSAGDKVWLDTRNFSTMYNKKIRPKREGPFLIKEVLGNVTYRLKLPKTWKIHDVFHAVHLSPYRETAQYGTPIVPPTPDLVEGQEEYEVDHIVRHKRNNKGQLLFLIRWKGYDADGDSWEPAKNLIHAAETLQEYKRRKGLV